MSDLAGWVRSALGHDPRDLQLFERALTHSSRGPDHYERLEFLGDRVLGLTVATWLYELFSGEPEGKLSRRYNVLVSGETCAEVAREIGVAGRMRLGKQAREDGAADSENVLGDMTEALIGALYLDGGLDAAITFIRSAWNDKVNERESAPKHPKSALQEWAAANEKKPPVYELADRSGPPHAPRFLVEVSIKGIGEARAAGSTKQEAETEAARALLEKLG